MINKRKYATVLLDFDGTIVDPNKRLYSLFIELTGSNLTEKDYWLLKKRGLKQKEMLEYVNFSGDKDKFHKIWLQNVERRDLIEIDSLKKGVLDGISMLSNEDYAMYIISNRQSIDMLEHQLQYLGIFNFFKGIYSTRQKCSKSETIRLATINLEKAIFVGDSCEDVIAATELGLPCIRISENDDPKATFTVRGLKEAIDIIVRCK